MPQSTPLKDKSQKLETAIGLDKPAFLAKIKSMQAKWKALAKQGDYEETRIIAPYLFNKTKRTPVNTSILSDNLEYFSKNYTDEYSDRDLKGLLEIACLSGSKKVADFLLERLGKTYVSEDCQFVLGYVSASPNVEWTKEIAKVMAKAGLKMPEDISSLTSSRELVKEISMIFQSTKKETASKLSASFL